jgi:hypothetical protein
MIDIPAIWGRAAGATAQGLIDRHDLVATLDRVVGKRQRPSRRPLSGGLSHTRGRVSSRLCRSTGAASLPNRGA